MKLFDEDVQKWKQFEQSFETGKHNNKGLSGLKNFTNLKKYL